MTTVPTTTESGLPAMGCPSCGAVLMPWSCPCGYEVAVNDGLPTFAPEVAAVDDGYDPAYFARLAKVEPRHFWFRNRNALLTWALDKFFPDARSLLEIGCGTGFVLSGFQAARPHLSLHGSELHTQGLAFARRRLSNAQFFQADARRLPFRAAFDVIGAFDVLEHIDEDEMVLGQLYDAVRPGGGVMLTVPQHRWLWSSVDALSGHKRRYAVGELADKVRRAGFEVQLATSFVALLLPLIWAARRKSRAADVDDVMAQFDINPWLNEALHAALRVEQAIVRIPGVSVPWGSSALVIARRPHPGSPPP